jgi:predicted nucleic acid-binding protein
MNAAEIALKHKLDMDDAIQYSTALSLGVEAIVSFDKHFNNLEIPRTEPPLT